MKIFTRVMLIIAGVLTTIGAVCLIIGLSMGLNWTTFNNLVEDGKFSFDIGDVVNIKGINGLHIEIFDDSVHVGVADGETGSSDVEQECVKMDVEYGAGLLEIYYGDVEKIHIDYEQVVGFESSIEDGTLRIEGGLGVSEDSDAALVIIIPKDMVFEKVELEVGASEAKISDLKAQQLKIAVGVGEATLRNLDVKELDAETGVGQLNIELTGKETDYSYNLDCGIGAIIIGDNSYGGFGSSHSVHHQDTKCHMDIDCGIGEVKVTFTE